MTANSPELNDYGLWLAKFTPKEEELAAQRSFVWEEPPLISVVVPVHDTEIICLREMIESVLNQTYAHWELCVADGDSISHRVREVIKEYAKRDSRVKYVFLKENTGISGHTNEAAKLASGSYLAFVDSDDILAPNALFEVAKAIAENPGAALLYTDSDYWDSGEGKAYKPQFKPGWSPVYFLFNNYIVHLVVIAKALFDQAGKLAAEYDGCQDTDIILKVSEISDQFIHIPRILYSWRKHRSQTSLPKSLSQANRLSELTIQVRKDHLKRMGLSEEDIKWFLSGVVPSRAAGISVSVLIPFYGGRVRLNQCLDSIFKQEGPFKIEIIIVDLSEADENWEDEYAKGVKVTKIPSHLNKWNVSEVYNFAAESAKGEYLVFLNSHSLLREFTFTELLRISLYPKTGAAGCAVHYYNNMKFFVGGQEYAGSNMPLENWYGRKNTLPKTNITTGFFNVDTRINNVTALSDVCVMIRRDLFDLSGGFATDYPLTFFMTDLCLRLRGMGCYNILYRFPLSCWQAEHPAYGRALENFNSELAVFKGKYERLLRKPDPYLNPNAVLY